VPGRGGGVCLAPRSPMPPRAQPIPIRSDTCPPLLWGVVGVVLALCSARPSLVRVQQSASAHPDTTVNHEPPPPTDYSDPGLPVSGRRRGNHGLITQRLITGGCTYSSYPRCQHCPVDWARPYSVRRQCCSYRRHEIPRRRPVQRVSVPIVIFRFHLDNLLLYIGTKLL